MTSTDQIQPMSFKSALILFLGFLAAQIFVAIIAVICIYILHIDYERSPYFMLVGYAICMVLPILFYDLFVLKPVGKRLSFNLRSRPVSVYLIIFPMMFGMMLMSEYLVGHIPTTGYFFGAAYQEFTDQMSSLAMDNVSMIIMTVILAPILEEILFRGILQKAMINNGTKPMVAILISSFVFGAIHGYPWQFVGGFFLALVLGVVYYKTKSLLMPILLHAFNNLICALLIMYSGHESIQAAIGLSPIICFLLGLIIFGLSFYWFIFRKAIIFGE